VSGVLPNPAAHLRGTATGLLTGALAVAAHGVGSAAPPTGSATAQLVVLAVTVGALAATIRHATDARVLLGLLATGQLLGHVMLGAVSHSHTPATTPPGAAMLAAHLVAIATGALLIAAGDRLVRTVCPPMVAMPVVATGNADQPLRSALLLAASVSHRGPPVSLAR
jgi:hypothetical protein